MTYKILADDDTRAIITDVDTAYDTFEETFTKLKFATSTAIRTCGEIIAAVYLDLSDEPIVMMHRIDVSSDTNTSTVQLIETETATVIASFRCVDVDANDGNDET